MFQLILFFGFFVSWAQAKEPPLLLTTLKPFSMIIVELAGPDFEVESILPPGISPHDYELRPSDLKHSGRAKVLFWGSDGVDPWAKRLPAPKKQELMALVPESKWILFTGHDGHGHSGIDPHFWTDPLAVESALPPISHILCGIKPEACDAVKAREKAFQMRLIALDQEIRKTLTGLRSRDLVLNHPSFGYFARRYDLKIPITLEPAPGKEPSMQGMQGILGRASALGILAVFTEVSAPKGPVQVLSRALKVPIVELDPMGGKSGMKSYDQLILWNGKRIAEALK